MKNSKFSKYILAGFAVAMSWMAFLGDTRAQSTEKSDNVALIVTGRITKVDRKDNTITIQERAVSADQTERAPQPSPGNGGPRLGRRGLGGIGRGGGIGRRGQLPQAATGKETKVLINDATVIKNDAGETVTSNALQVGDFVQIKGTTKDKDFEAKEIQQRAESESGRNRSR